MSGCCSSASPAPKTQKLPCPGCGSNSLNVPSATLLHHLKTPWVHELGGQVWFFCDSPQCDLVYFSSEGNFLKKDELRSVPGVKESGDQGLICFCYGVNKAQAKDPDVKAFVVAQTKEKNCACEIRNPSGRCCLKNFPKPAPSRQKTQ